MMDGTHWRRRGPDWETCGRCGVRGRETVAQRRRPPSRDRHGATYPWLIMLSLGGERGPLYVSAKRTQFFWRGKQVLSNCGAIGSDAKVWLNNLGSFWKNEPNLGVF